MSGFISNSAEYDITTESEVANMLSHFNTEYIFDFVKENLQRKSNFYPTNPPNAISAFESNFKIIMNLFPQNEMEITNVRIETYKEIIKILCNEYSLKFNDSEQDYFSAAYYLYGFLISGFSSGIISFFANYIIREKNSIYESTGLANMKKNKDISTVYNKKIYKNSKLAIINANLEYVIDNICQYDMPLDVILNSIYTDKNIVKYIDNCIDPINDFFKSFYVPFVQSNIKPLILTNIRFEIKKLLPDSNEL